MDGITNGTVIQGDTPMITKNNRLGQIVVARLEEQKNSYGFVMVVTDVD